MDFVDGFRAVVGVALCMGLVVLYMRVFRWALRDSDRSTVERDEVPEGFCPYCCTKPCVCVPGIDCTPGHCRCPESCVCITQEPQE
jgi:hypothetical protein